LKTAFLVLSLLIPLAGTMHRSVPPAPSLTRPNTSAETARTHALLSLLNRSANAFDAAEFQHAEVLASNGYENSLAARQPLIAVKFLNIVGACRFSLHQYQNAFESFLGARRLAETSGNNTFAGILDLNLASLYSQLGQIDMAAQSAERALARITGRDRAKYLPAVFIQLASLRAQQQRMPEALEMFRRGIAAAEGTGDTGLSAQGWNRLGEEYLRRGDLAQAEPALLEAYRIRKLNHLASVETSYRNLGDLRLQQRDLSSASVLLDKAVERSERAGGLLPTWSMYFYRGQVRLAQNRLRDALRDLRIAVQLERTWRRAAPPADATRVSLENWRDVPALYAALIETGNKLYFETHEPSLAQETFEAAEENRAASLRQLLAEARGKRRAFPPAYWETLRKLESAEVALLRAPPAGSGGRIPQLQAALLEFEARAGSNNGLEVPDLLTRLRRRLPRDAAFFSFHLSAPNSYLWAVSRDDLAVYRLPAVAEIARLAGPFREAVREGRPDLPDTGKRLYQALFGPLAPRFQQKPHWLLALDAELFELPFAALVAEDSPVNPVFLAERHSLEITSGAGMVAMTGTPLEAPFSGSFLGIADAVYNTADPRWRGARTPGGIHSSSALSAAATESEDLHLARLPGSAREVRACAAAWGGARESTLLLGSDASRARLIEALNSRPAVLHFATHVLHSSQGARAGFIVLGLTDRGQHEILSSAEISGWDLGGALVSLSGCSSGEADALPGTGLMGLTRAWLAAGAGAVIASRWPTPDDTGTLFLSFYRHLREAPQTGPAVALQQAQVDMVRSQTWRSRPRYWGAYFLVGN
jgi:CHAT domain-containing protein